MLHTVISLTVLLSVQTSTMIMEIEILFTVYVKVNSNPLYYGYESCNNNNNNNNNNNINNNNNNNSNNNNNNKFFF